MLHHDKIQKAGSVIEAAKTPTTDPKVTTATDPTPNQEPNSVVHVEIPHVATSTPSAPNVPALPNLVSTMDKEAFAEQVWAPVPDSGIEPESAQVSQVLHAPTMTRSGRTSRKFVGNRLIDTMFLN